MNFLVFVIQNLHILLLAILLIAFVLKIVLYIKFEKQWDPIGFFYYPKPLLKMTNSMKLKKSRMLQNKLTYYIIGCVAILIFFIVFKSLILGI